MNWTDQMQQLMRSWTEAQQKMASEWTTAIHQAGAPGQATAGDWATQWREQAARNFETYLGTVGGVPGSVAQRMFAGAQTYNQFVDFISAALRDMAPKMESGADWVAALKQHMDALQEKMNGQPHLWMKPESMAAMGGDASELWRLFLSQTQAMAAPWLASLGQSRGHLGEAMGGDHRAVIRMANLFTDTFESTMGKFLGAPAIGYSREHQEKLTKTFEAWVDMKRAEVAFNTELTAIGFRAMGALVDRLKAMASKGEKIESSRKLFDLWVEVAEKTYFEAASTEAFAQTQADLVNASMHHKVHEKVLLEIFYKAVHLPTRQEIDDAYKHMHELRSQVKKLTKTAAALQAEVASLTESRHTALAASQATAKALSRLQSEVTSLTEFRKATLAASRATEKASARLQSEVASLAEFRKATLAASRAKGKASNSPADPAHAGPARKKTAAAPRTIVPDKVTAEPTGKTPAAKAVDAPKTAPSTPKGTRTARTKAKEG
ncbi:MAG: class III poly(R)-hydroxyalkanoic acid synthase subunit PhaE [Deferrisomatales bacterium]|nr:class III poly(R)-hydroxyalkanoic acid synthase subunit PhaE [Deferrisomatales bacterium]